VLYWVLLQGVLDCILCRPDGVAAATAAVAHLRGALASPGTLLVFSHGPPSRRLPLLRTARWTNITVRRGRGVCVGGVGGMEANVCVWVGGWTSITVRGGGVWEGRMGGERRGGHEKGW
jgi:hypothetical protein